MCIVSIHQPNFFPHKAFFDKMKQSDVFVLMSEPQFEKGGYQNRFNIGDEWYTMSVNAGLDPIKEKRYVNETDDFKKILQSLPKYKHILHQFWIHIEISLSETNICIIEDIAELLEIKTPIKYDYPTVLKGTERLVHICQNYGATKYLSGVSGKNYMDLSLFDKAGIEVIFQEPSPSKPILEVLYERQN